MKHSRFLIGAAIFGLSALGQAAFGGGPTKSPPVVARADSRPPNIVLIVADDLGYGDTGVYGSTSVRTPNIDALAADGVRFTQGYVTHPVCAPSRAGLLTGRYQERFGYELNPRGRDEEGGVALDEVMIGQLLKAKGYATGMVGKWHLGQRGAYYPTSRGFDEYFGMVGGGSTYIVDPKPGDEFFTSPRIAESERLDAAAPASAARPTPPAAAPNSLAALLRRARDRLPISRNGEVVEVTDYLTDAFTNEGLLFIDRHRDGPFFLYMAYNAPHLPLMATAKYVERYHDVPDKATRIYDAMVSALDDGVGALRARLRQLGLERNTLIVFLSDNGCPVYLGAACSNGSLAGYKATPFEGGVRVPFIMAWPGRLPSGRTDGRVVSSLDVVPTAAAAAGARLPSGRPYDGVDLVPFLTGSRSGSPHRTLYWRAGPTLSIRRGDDKLILANKASGTAENGSPIAVSPDDRSTSPPYPAVEGRHAMLYDLAKDEGEKRNLATAAPDRAAALKRDAEKWSANLAPPQWPSERQFRFSHDGTALHLYD